MNIAVNTRLLIKDNLDGIGWFSCETLKRITRKHPEHTFHFIFDRKYHDSFIFSDNVVPHVLPPFTRHPLLYVAWFEASLPYLLRKIKPDLFLSPDGFLSLRSSVPSVSVIHDLNFEHYPKDLPRVYQKYYHHYFPKFARKATRIATVSEYSKKDIINIYGIPNDKIDVVFNGANEDYVPVNEERKAMTRRIYAKNKPYFVFIGSLHPRKNLGNLFKAFDLYKKKTGLDSQLVIVGKKKWWTEDIHQAFEEMEHQSDVIFTGRLSTRELANVIASALALTYVSNFEGFGIPIVEAMYCGTPVITSNVTSMPEIGGDAVLTVNPFSVDSISNAMEKIAKDDNLRQELIRKGAERRKMFSWNKTADRLWDCVEKAVKL